MKMMYEKLSRSKISDFFFRIFDKDDDGLISVEELRHIMLSFGEKMTEKELDEMVAEANCDKDGHIDYEGETNQPLVKNKQLIIRFCIINLFTFLSVLGFQLPQLFVYNLQFL